MDEPCIASFAAPCNVKTWGNSTTRNKLCNRRNRRTAVTTRSCTGAEKDKTTTGGSVENEKGDIIERIWTAVFGKKQAEPFGLKRFDRGRFPELYYGTLEEFADPVESDDELAALIRPMLKYTQLESRPIQLVYDAARDSWDAEAFHSNVDKKGAAIVIAKTEGGALCGGYSPKGFVGYGETRGSKAAFMFTWPDGDTSKNPMKMLKVAGAGLAVIDEPDTGPRFGSGELYIPLRPPRAEWEQNDRDRRAMSKLGSYYQRRPDGRNCLFADGESGKGTLLAELKVYTGVYGEGEEIPFNDAIPFALE